jgi:hypothetical protein
MTMPEPADGPGYRVTLKDVDKKVDDLATETRAGMQKILDRLPDNAHVRLRKLESQMAAQWIVTSIAIVAIGGLVTKVLNP